MNVINFILDHSYQILQLCGGVALVGVGIFCLYLCRVVFHATRVIRKIDDLSSLFVEYVQKPVASIVALERTYKKWAKFADFIPSKDKNKRSRK